MSARMKLRRVVHAGILLAASIVARSSAAAGGPSDPGDVSRRPVVLPQLVTMNEALRTFREHGFDALLADAATMHAEGEVEAAAHVANPGVSLSGGYTFNLPAGQSPWSWTVALTDNGAIFELLSGKRTLRARSARAALDAARKHRASVELGLEANVKQAYVHVGMGRLQVEFTEQQVQSLTKTVDLARLRYPQVIDESDLARVEVQKLEADQAVTRAKQALREAQAELALLVGVRGAIPDFDVDRGVLGYRVPAALASTDEAALLSLARAHRPEILEWKSNVVQADEALSYERRRVFPDVALSGFYAASDTPIITPPLAGGGISFDLPIFYQQQGEIRRAEADFAGQSILARRADAQIAADVAGAYAAMTTARAQVDRMLGGELDASTRQRDILQKQFDAGKADLNDYLDAQRTYLTVQLEYLQFVAAYWSAVFALERSTGTDLR
jgi:cobalt-zinc-cadmium efflux system outer membrane protein